MIKQFKGEYSWLSNFAPVLIKEKQFTYHSVEHAYMSAKCDDISWKIKCSSNEISAGKIKKLSRNIQLRPDWDQFKLIVMNAALWQKFRQEPYYSLLRNTGDEFIQEGNEWNDRFWGVDLKTGKGKNMLGIMIMNIRNELCLKVY